LGEKKMKNPEGIFKDLAEKQTAFLAAFGFNAR
jgi:hypothetical protein